MIFCSEPKIFDIRRTGPSEQFLEDLDQNGIKKIQNQEDLDHFGAEDPKMIDMDPSMISLNGDFATSLNGGLLTERRRF